MSIKDNLVKIKKEIPSHIVIEAAAKTRSIHEIKQAIDAGIKVIGENYIQEAEAKHEAIPNKVNLHYLGHLQTNKVKKAVNICDMIETVDSEKLAREIDKHCKTIKKVMPILIQINSGKEKQKKGVMPNDALQLIKKIAPLKNIKVKGLMTIAPLTKKPEQVRSYFKLTKNLFDTIKKQKIPRVEMKILSMGMSNSYLIAIEEGATMIRIGTSIFGSRKK